MNPAQTNRQVEHRKARFSRQREMLIVKLLAQTAIRAAFLFLPSFRRSVVVLFLFFGGTAQADWPAARSIDPGRLDRAGLRVIASEHCELVTDMAPSPEIDQLPHLIDLALPQWAKRFDVEASQTVDWRMRAYFISDRTKFEALGLMPQGREDFPHGLAVGNEIWIYDQPTDYYRRCLWLHEATHSFMMTTLGSCGPGWYMEGVAELCGAHTWDQPTDTLRLAIMPADKRASPMWGRIKLLRDAAEKGEVATIRAVQKINNRVAMSTHSYAWVWALSYFLDHHPSYHDRFAVMPGWVLSEQFARRFDRAYKQDRKRLDQEWRLFVSTLDYGHDLQREAIAFKEGKPFTGSKATVSIAAGRGWQSSGVRVEAGHSYRIRGKGRFVIAQEKDGTPWPCEASGVTLAYHRGRPLGELLATIDAGPDAVADARTDAFTQFEPIGQESLYTPERSGTLYLRVNDAPNRLAENSGTLEVTIE